MSLAALPKITKDTKGKGKAIEAHSDSSSSVSGSSDSDTDSSSDSESEEELVTPEYLESLLQKARENASKRRITADDIERQEDEIIKLDDEPEQTPLPSLDPGKLPQLYFTLGKTRRDGLVSVLDPDIERAKKDSSSYAIPAPPIPPPVGKQLTKKEKKALKDKTAGPDWFDLPAPPEAELPRLHREVEALRLRNQLDPKRFYKKDDGEGKGIKGLPKHFAIGTIIPSSTPFGTASADNLTRAERKRTIVDELVDDAEAKRYAKKKFEELQGVRGAKGRGTYARKRARMKRKW